MVYRISESFASFHHIFVRNTRAIYEHRKLYIKGAYSRNIMSIIKDDNPPYVTETSWYIFFYSIDRAVNFTPIISIDRCLTMMNFVESYGKLKEKQN